MNSQIFMQCLCFHEIESMSTKVSVKNLSGMHLIQAPHFYRCILFCHFVYLIVSSFDFMIF